MDAVGPGASPDNGLLGKKKNIYIYIYLKCSRERKQNRSRTNLFTFGMDTKKAVPLIMEGFEDRDMVV
jgi:hypothetical protein